jgi:hypothetical protein
VRRGVLKKNIFLMMLLVMFGITLVETWLWLIGMDTLGMVTSVIITWITYLFWINSILKDYKAANSYE